jgi:glutamine amidotransferase
VIAVLDSGMGTLRSGARAIERVGGKPDVTDDAEAIDLADALVVPGVGHFGACMRNLVRAGLDHAVRRFVAGGRPLLGVCLGMQVLFAGSEEDPHDGRGVLPGGSRRLPAGVKVPHMGWNTVEWSARHPFVDGIPDGTRFYFVHSYASDVLPGITVGVTEHGRRFAAVVAKDNVFATQFHPERSGDAGLALYEAFVREAE